MTQDKSEKDYHSPDEARPQDTTVEFAPRTGFGLHDSAWSDDQWRSLLVSLIDQGMLTWREVTALTLGHLNPSQVGTSLASSDGFKRRYGKGNTMRIVMEWAYTHDGRCVDCGSRLELQADHVEGREHFDDPMDADFIENMTLRCRRCNVIRRPSHEYGGQTFLTAEAALMWILLVIRPRTLIDFIRLCRIYGMTMADIRMQEAWAMAHWLSRSEPPLFGIEDDEATSYNLLLWKDGTITRTDIDGATPSTAEVLYSHVPGDHYFTFVASNDSGRKRLFIYPMTFIPFSTYDLGDLPPNALAIRYTPPNRHKGVPQQIVPLAPGGMILVSHAIIGADEKLIIRSRSGNEVETDLAPEATRNGKLLPRRYQDKKIELTTEASL